MNVNGINQCSVNNAIITAYVYVMNYKRAFIWLLT